MGIQENFIMQNNKAQVCYCTRLDPKYEQKHLAGVNKVIFDANQDFLVTASRDGNVRLFEMAENSESKNALEIHFSRILSQHNGWVNDITLLRNSKIVSVGNDCTVNLMDEPIYQHNDYIKAVTFLDSRPNAIYTAGLDCVIKSYDVAARPANAQNIFTTQASVYCLAGSNNLLAYGTNNSVVEIFDVRDRKNVIFHQKINNQKYNTGENCVLSNLKFLGDNLLVMSDYDGYINIFDLRLGGINHNSRYGDAVTHLDSKSLIQNIPCGKGISSLEMCQIKNETKIYAGLLREF